jgi:hypothetical protein
MSRLRVLVVQQNRSFSRLFEPSPIFILRIEPGSKEKWLAATKVTVAKLGCCLSTSVKALQAESNAQPASTSHPTNTTASGPNATPQRLNMATDEDYVAFLNKANQDPNEGYVHVQNQGAHAELKAMDAGASAPEPLVRATRDAFYVSDADEPFVPVSLRWDEGGRGLPDEGAFYSAA